MNERIQELTEGLAAIADAIAKTQAAIDAGPPPDELRAQNSRLTALQSQQSGLQTELNNLQAAGTEVRAIRA